MPIWIANFLASKIVAPLALAGCLILAVVAGVQTVRINGISVFGWYAVDGFKPLYEASIRETATLRGNQDALKTGLAACKASVTSAEARGEAHGRTAQKATDAAHGAVVLSEAEAKYILSIKPGANGFVTAYYVGLKGTAK